MFAALRRFALLAVAISAFIPFASLGAAVQPHVKCPPLSRVQHFREVAVNKAAQDPDTAPITALSAEELPRFCRNYKTTVLCAGGEGIKLTKAQVVAIDAGVRANFEYRDDYVQFGRGDVWLPIVTCGDCEDYALTTSQVLHAVGQAGWAMRLMMWEPEPGSGHATLLVDTADAGVIEIGVGDPAQPFDVTQGRRFATIRMDGRRQVLPERGFSYHDGAIFAPATK